MASKLSELTACLPGDEAALLQQIVARGQTWPIKLGGSIGSSRKGSWTRGYQDSLMQQVKKGRIPVNDMLNLARDTENRSVVQKTHEAHVRSIRHWKAFTREYGLPDVLPPPDTNAVTPLMATILRLAFTHMKLRIMNAKTRRMGEASGLTIRNHVARALSAMADVGAPWPDCSEILRRLQQGHDKQMIDINGLVETRKANPTTVEIYRIFVTMDWTSICDPSWKVTYLALFLTLWEGLFRQASLIQTNPSEPFSPHWSATLKDVKLLVPPSHSLLDLSQSLLQKALRVQGAMISLRRPPVKNNVHRPTDPMLTHIRKQGNALKPGHYLALHVMRRLKEETDWMNSMPINVSLRPLFLDVSGKWMTESIAKKIFKAAVAKALSIRDGTAPSPQVLARFTLYSNKVGKKVHMDFVPAIDGTLTRQIGGWAPAAGDAPYSRIHPAAIGNAHTATNSVKISVIE